VDIPPVEVESATWFAWLDQVSSFRFRGQAGGYTARKESRRYGATYWYAYVRLAGKLVKRYLGRSADLTLARLEERAEALQLLLYVEPTSKHDPIEPAPLAGVAREMVERSLPPLLATRMHIPQAREELVPRPRLLEKLKTGLSCPLTLITAPAGFGKTTLASSWLRALPVTTAWLSLDSDDDLVCFWSYVFSALRPGYPTICTALLEQLQAPGLQQSQRINHLLTKLLNELVANPQETILVLDDYHLVTSPAIHASMTFLLEHLPPALHIVLATRIEPPLPLARWRAHNLVLDLQLADLRFTLDEVGIFLNRVMKLHLSADELLFLLERTEGWPVALQLAGLSLQQVGTTTQAAFSRGGQRSLFAYLAAEVLQGQSLQIQDFLLRTAPLTRLNADLCNAVTACSVSHTLLSYLDQANLFVVALDEIHGWYRYHQLFAEFLAARLQDLYPDQVATLHRRAADWYEAHGYLAEAIHHLRAIDDFARLAHIIEISSDQMLRRGEFGLLLQWLDLLPLPYLRTSVQLSLISARTQAFSGHLEAATTVLQELETRLVASNAERLASIDGEIIATHALIAIMRLETDRAIDLAKQALHLLPYHVFIRSILTLSLGIAYRSHDTEAASKALGEAIRQADNPHVAVMSICHFAYQLQTQGQLERALEWYQQALDFLPGEQHIPAMSVALLGCAEIQRERNNLAAAEKLLEEAMPLGQAWTFLGILTGIVATLALVKQAQGDYSGARSLLRQQFQRAEQQHDLTSLASLRAYLALLDLAEGNAGAAQRWAEEFAENGPLDDLDVLREREYLAFARIQIASGQFSEAALLLKRLIALSTSRQFCLLKISILQVLLLQGQGESEQALEMLAWTLTLAEAEGFIRLFVEERALLTSLLVRVIERQQQNALALDHPFSPAYAQTILQAMEGRCFSSEQPPPEPLSERECEIMCLIARGLSNQQIASQLVIALSTVKWHIKQMYNKLNINSRTQLLAYARGQGWL
jgi:LuxR family maltose regulon positive regulatory protein